jgi:glycine/D-amino acid oxidase-like deaminating enzyme
MLERLAGALQDGYVMAHVMFQGKNEFRCRILTGVQNGGHCQPILFQSPQDPSIALFERQNFKIIQRLVRERDIECEFVAQEGVKAIYDDHYLSIVKQNLSILKKTHSELASLMILVTDRDTLVNLRVPTALAAVVTKEAARMWPYKFVTNFLEELVTTPQFANRFNLQTWTPVESLTQDHERVLVNTPRSTIIAKKVVLATNGYTSHLLPDFTDLIVPCRGQMSALIPPESLAGDNRLRASYGFEATGTDDYLVQRSDNSGGELMFGGGRAHSNAATMGVSDDSEVDDKTSEYLRRQLVNAFVLPGHTGQNRLLEASHMWTGIMGYSRDDHPWVGPVPGHPNVYMAAGYTGHGMPNSWLCGLVIAECVSNTLVSGMGDEFAFQQACGAHGLPIAYKISEERLRRARTLETVQSRDAREQMLSKQNNRAEC